MAGLGEVCSHVAALLFKVEMAVKMGLNQTSSTSKACQWNSTFRKEVKPATVTDIFEQIKGRRKKDVVPVQANGKAELPPPEVLDELYSLVANAAFFTSVTAPSQVKHSKPVQTNTAKYPELLTTFHDPDIDHAIVDNKCQQIFETYSCTQYQVNNLEAATRNQSVSPLWYQHRMGRVTASKAHDVWTRKTSTPPDNLIMKIVGYSSYDLSKKESVKWGIDHEDECRQIYTKHQITQHLNFKCQSSGFCINHQYPFLGASPDGIISCDCCNNGIIEIKCPFKHKDVTVQHAATTDPDFCLDKNLHLKSNHRYYTQVQFQMFILQVPHCDFVVYTKPQPTPSLVIVRVPFNADFCTSLVSLCQQFVKQHVIKELVSRQLESTPLQAITPQDDNNNDRTTWCICSEPEYGRMVKCDNSDCPYQWFHYKCVNIRRKPRGHWFCYSCDV